MFSPGRKLFRGEKAQGMVEYILIVALIAVAAIVALKAFGGKITGWFSSASQKIDGAMQ